MILFHNWAIENAGGILARQHDNLSRALVVSGVPEGWDWAMQVQAGDSFDKLLLSPAEDGVVGIVLTEDMLALDGFYSMQLVGTLQSDGVTVRHTNVITVLVPGSLSGSGQWPTVPSEFTQMEQRMQELNAHPPVPGENGFWLVWDPRKHEYRESGFALPSTGSGGYRIGTGLKLDTKTNTLSVDTAEAVEQDNTKPVTSAAVYTEIGNIEALLAAL